MTHLTFAEAIIVGLIQGTTELFPVSSLGHNVLIPAIVGGSWANDLDVSKAESPYLAFIVGLHVATAIGITAYFWRDWLRIIGGFFSSIAHREVRTPDQKLAWMIVLATIPVGLVGLVFLGGTPDVAPITVVLASLSGTRGSAWYLLSAGAFVAMIVPVVVFMALQRFFVRGLLAGGLKG